jgi:hypothetical protein
MPIRKLYSVHVCYETRGFSRCGWLVQADSPKQAERKVEQIFPLNSGDELEAIYIGIGCLHDDNGLPLENQIRSTKSPEIMREWYQAGRL